MVQLDGTGSTVSGGSLTCSWQFTETPAGESNAPSRVILDDPTSATPTFTPDLYGQHVLYLTATSGQVSDTRSGDEYISTQSIYERSRIVMNETFGSLYLLDNYIERWDISV